MGKVMYMKKGDVHTVPSALVYLTDDNGNVVTATSASDNTDETEQEVKKYV